MSSSIECPQCKSTQIRVQQPGFSGSKASGSDVANDGDASAGLYSGNDIENHCLNCGYSWKPANEFNAGFEERIQTEFFDEQKVKTKFYEDYESGQFENAKLSIPQSVNELYEKQGLHAAYNYLKSLDKGSEKFKSSLLAGGLVILLVIVLLFIRSCS